MNGKERVTKAIALERPDRVPLGMYVMDCDTVERVIGRKTLFRNRIGMQLALWEGRRDEVVEGLKRDAVELYEKLDCIDIVTHKDAVLVPPKNYEPLRPKKIADDAWEDKNGVVYKASYLSNDIVVAHRPAKPAKPYTVADFESEPEDAPPDPTVFEVYDHVMERLAKTRYVAGMAGHIVGMVLLDGMESGLMYFASDPEVVEAATRRSVRQANLADKHYLRGVCEGVLMEQDQATTKGPMISPALYRRIALPAMKERVAQVRSRGKQVLFHCCGNAWKLVDMFIEAGVQCYQSLQAGCMDLGQLKEKYGKRLAFWGGVAVDKLVMGTPEDVRKDVRYAMERAAPGGGFILGPSHSVAYGTKYENFRAMLDEHDRLKDKF